MKRIGFLIFVTVVLVIVSHFAHSIYSLLHKKDVIIQAQNELNRVKNENTDLKKQLSYAKNPEFVEEQARDKLFLVKPGENTVVIPNNILLSPTPEPKKIQKKSTWLQWLNIFGW